jgi:ribA/ribD-fused uncharacterized protein
MISFYSTQGPYGEFSNFSPHGIRVEGKWYPTTEHYFQAQKFHDEAYREQIRQARSPMIAARLGQSRKVPLRSDWEEIKLDVMRGALREKFTSHRELKTLLLGTGDEELVENSPTDIYWGCGKDGSGQNWLGKLLMELREDLRHK